MRRAHVLAGLAADACVLAITVRLWVQAPLPSGELRPLLALSLATAVTGMAAVAGAAVRRGAGTAASLTGLCAVAPLLATSAFPPELRTLGPALLAVSVVPLLLAKGRCDRGDRVVVGAAVTGFSVMLLSREPFLEPTCSSFCGHNPWLVVAAPGLVAAVQLLLAAVLLLWSVRLVRALVTVPRPAVPFDRGQSVALLVVTGCAAGGLVARGLGVTGEHQPAVVVGQLLTVLLLHASRVTEAIRAVRVRRHVRLLSADLAAHARLGHADDWLRHAVQDPSVRVLAPDEARRPGTAATVVRRAGMAVTTLEHTPAAAGRVQRAVTPLVAMALDNDRVHAQAVAQLEQLVASRRRIVATADAARRQMERDLHDGAQQRLLVLGMHLAAASEHAADAERAVCRRGVEITARALSELRAVANGVLPVVLDQLGLLEALRDLAGVLSFPVELDVAGDSGVRAPQDVERVAYRVASSVLRQAGENGATRGWVQVRRDDRRLTLLVGHDGGGAEDSSDEQDRVGALRGSWSAATSDRGVCVTVVLPCE